MEYQDILNSYHYELRYHPKMSKQNRAAQFAPFAALTGYEEAVKETARTTTKKKQLTEDELEQLNYQLQEIEKELEKKPVIKITYFEKDKRKIGGKYLEYIGKIKKIDSIKKEIIFFENKKIIIKNIIKIEIIKSI